MPPPLPTLPRKHERFSDFNWTRPVLLSTRWGCSENQVREKERRVFRRNVTSPGPLPTALCPSLLKPLLVMGLAWTSQQRMPKKACFSAPLQSLSVNIFKIFHTYIFTQLQFSYFFLIMIRGSFI